MVKPKIVNSKEDQLILNTIKVFDEDKKNIFSQILKCAICLEVPKKRQKVMMCEKGHHFCSDCHSRIEKCGVCRAGLLKSRNFVVEELVTKLGVILGCKEDLPAPNAPIKYRPGSYLCQHNCLVKTASHLMLPHIRLKHSSQLIDNMRSNPHDSQFSCSYKIPFKQDYKEIISVQISDMGLFTVYTFFRGLNFFSFIKVLGDRFTSSHFQCNLAVKLSSITPVKAAHQFCAIDCPVATYFDDEESITKQGKLLKIKDNEFLEHINPGGVFTFFFSIQFLEGRKRTTEEFVSSIPDKPLVFSSDRKSRRNKKRNLRRKLVKSKLKALNLQTNEMVKDLSRLSVTHN